MKIYNICSKQTYERNGETKTVWLPVGSKRVLDDGKEFITWNANPDTSYYVFEQKTKEEPKSFNEEECF